MSKNLVSVDGMPLIDYIDSIPDDNQKRVADSNASSLRATSAKPRFYHVDWLRTIAVHMVAYIHSVSTAEELRNFNFPNLETDDPKAYAISAERIDGARRVILQMGIPLFFYISGFSITFFNTEKKSFTRYFCDKVKRLIIPLIIVFFIFMIPRNYLD